MDNILVVLGAAVSITLVDIDNALYTTGQIGTLDSHRRLVLLLSLILEFIGRLGLLLLFALLTNETEPLFTIFGIPITLEALSLFIAGTYLILSNGRALVTGSSLDEEAGETAIQTQPRSLPRLLVGMAVVLTIMSVDTVLFLNGLTTVAGVAIFILLFSAVVRLLFIESLVHFIKLYPAVQVVVLFILVFIGVELILQGFGLDNEIYFNIILIAILLFFVAYRRRQSPTKQGQA